MSYLWISLIRIATDQSKAAEQIVYNVVNPPPSTAAVAPVVKAGIEYSDLVSITLTAVTVILAILAIFVAVLAIWGYAQFKQMTQNASENHIEKLISDGSLKDLMDAAIVRYMTEQLEHGELREVVDRLILSDAGRRADEQAASSEDTEVPFEG